MLIKERTGAKTRMRGEMIVECHDGRDEILYVPRLHEIQLRRQ